MDRFLDRGLRAKLAVDDEGNVGGMIQYLPIEQSHVDGEGLDFILCVWVHGHKEGRGDFRGSGMGSALLAAAEKDALDRGRKGMAAWGLWVPFWMKASWFKKHGYRKADRQGMAVLVWKPFAEDAQPPRWNPVGRRLPDPVQGKVNVTVFSNGWCMGMNLAAERARRAAEDLGDKVAYREIDTSGPDSAAKWGFTDAIFVDQKPVRTGPPPSYEKIRAIVTKRVRKMP